MNDVKVIEERKIDEATITLRSDGIIKIVYHDNVEVDPELQFRIMDIFHELCKDTKRTFLFTAMEYVTVTKEARLNAIKMEDVYPALATAVIADSVAYKLIANFYLKVNKPKTPYKVFSSEDKAVEWLRTFMK